MSNQKAFTEWLKIYKVFMPLSIGIFGLFTAIVPYLYLQPNEPSVYNRAAGAILVTIGVYLSLLGLSVVIWAPICVATLLWQGIRSKPAPTPSKLFPHAICLTAGLYIMIAFKALPLAQAWAMSLYLLAAATLTAELAFWGAWYWYNKPANNSICDD